MTTIIGVEHEGKVFMGADSQATMGWARETLTTRKIVRFNELLIGVAGNLRTVNLLQYYLLPPSRDPNITDDHFITLCLIPTMRQCFKDNGWLKIENSKEEGDDAFLVGYRGQCYFIGANFEVAHFKSRIAAIGSGGNYALGAMHALYSVQTDPYTPAKIEEHIKIALRVSAQLSIGVSEPFYVESI